MIYPENGKLSLLLRSVFVMLLIFGMFILSTSCKKQEKVAGPKEKVTLGVAQIVLSLPVIIAYEKGYFQDEGLDVEIKFFPSGKKSLEGMFAGEVAIATVAETPIMFNSFKRDDFVVFSTFAHSYNDCKVIGRKDKGVSSPKDLKGKKIGLTAGTSGHFFAHVYLAEHRIEPSSVTMVDFHAQDLPLALKDGKVDAIVTWEPYAYRALHALPGEVVRFPGSNLYRETFSFTVKKDYAKDHPEVLIRILKAVDKANSFIKQNRNEAIEIISKSVKIEKDLLNSVWEDFVFELTLDHSLMTTLEDEARWAMNNRLTDKTTIPNYLGYFYPDAIKTVKPEANTIVK